MPELFAIVLLGFWIFCLIDVVTSDSQLVRNLPKWLWVIIVLLGVTFGAILWFLLGRPHRTFSEGDRWEGGRYGTRSSRPQATRRSRPNPAERVEDEATIRARIEERDRLLARWAEEDKSRQQGEPPPSG